MTCHGAFRTRATVGSSMSLGSSCERGASAPATRARRCGGTRDRYSSRSVMQGPGENRTTSASQPSGTRPAEKRTHLRTSYNRACVKRVPDKDTRQAKTARQEVRSRDEEGVSARLPDLASVHTEPRMGFTPLARNHLVFNAFPSISK